MARNRTYSIEFTRHMAQEFLGGKTLYGMVRRHNLARNLIPVWVAKYEAGAFDDEFQATDQLQQYEGKIAALERLVGRQSLEIEFLQGAQKHAPSPRSVHTSVVAGPVVCPSPEDAA